MNVAVVGATGLVGSEMLRLLEQRNFPIDNLIPIASEKSIGSTISFQGKSYRIMGIEDGIKARPELALFSAGGATSLAYAEKFAAAGSTVIDNSSAWRMNPEKALIIPEINGDILSEKDQIIANPNCSTIQLLMVAAPLHREFQIERMIVSTYQSITGTGVKAVRQLENEEAGKDGENAYPHPIYRNCLPHCDEFENNGYTKEEMKLVNESRKILAEAELKITATAVRVPVVGGHSESVNLSFKKTVKPEEVRAILKASAGVVVVDEPARSIYPMPVDAKGKDDVFVGRIRMDESAPNSINLWIVADNLRKGAATNAIQIAELLLEKGLLE